MLPLFFSSSLLAGLAVSDIPSKISTSTECKSCPYSLCTNQLIYGYDAGRSEMNLTCWTEGTEIAGDTTWLKTNDSCYVTQYDLVEYSGDYTTDLPYCGRVQPKWAHAAARTRYYTECYIAPYMINTAIKYYKNNVDLDLTCEVPEIPDHPYRSTILNSTKWYKTARNCYVHSSSVWPVRDKKKLDNCGPIYLYLETDDHSPQPEETTSVSSPIAVPTATAPASKRSVTQHPRLDPRFLWSTNIGEEYVNCTSHSNSTDRTYGIQRVYEFNQTVFPQCGTTDGGEIMLFTTDFCWIKDTECWEQLMGDGLRIERFPHCEFFVDSIA